MRVLGVDPGLTRCGIGVVDGQAGRRITMIDVTVRASVFCTVVVKRAELGAVPGLRMNGVGVMTIVNGG